jgi:hypothetical protein
VISAFRYPLASNSWLYIFPTNKTPSTKLEYQRTSFQTKIPIINIPMTPTTPFLETTYLAAPFFFPVAL